MRNRIKESEQGSLRVTAINVLPALVHISKIQFEFEGEDEQDQKMLNDGVHTEIEEAAESLALVSRTGWNKLDPREKCDVADDLHKLAAVAIFHVDQISEVYSYDMIYKRVVKMLDIIGEPR